MKFSAENLFDKSIVLLRWNGDESLREKANTAFVPIAGSQGLFIIARKITEHGADISHGLAFTTAAAVCQGGFAGKSFEYVGGRLLERFEKFSAWPNTDVILVQYSDGVREGVEKLFQPSTPKVPVYV